MYAWLFLKTGKRSVLVFLFVFTVAAIYIHYYSMAAALVANSFVFAYLVLTKNRRWVHHLIAMLTAALLFLPWLFMFMVQVKRVQHAFWAPEVSLQTLLSCLAIPFTEHFWTTGFSKAMTILHVQPDCPHHFAEFYQVLFNTPAGIVVIINCFPGNASFGRNHFVIYKTNHPHEFLKPGEVYCAVRFHNVELNIENLDRALSESELIRTDTVRDHKVEDGIMIQVYLQAYKGSKTE